jgi:hypothetical protein
MLIDEITKVIDAIIMTKNVNKKNLNKKKEKLKQV